MDTILLLEKERLNLLFNHNIHITIVPSLYVKGAFSYYITLLNPYFELDSKIECLEYGKSDEEDSLLESLQIQSNDCIIAEDKEAEDWLLSYQEALTTAIELSKQYIK